MVLQKTKQLPQELKRSILSMVQVNPTPLVDKLLIYIVHCLHKTKISIEMFRFIKPEMVVSVDDYRSYLFIQINIISKKGAMTVNYNVPNSLQTKKEICALYHYLLMNYQLKFKTGRGWGLTQKFLNEFSMTPTEVTMAREWVHTAIDETAKPTGWLQAILQANKQIYLP